MKTEKVMFIYFATQMVMAVNKNSLSGVWVVGGAVEEILL